MSMPADKMVGDLRDAVDKHANQCHSKFIDATTERCATLLIWLAYLRSSISKNTADRLLDAIQATVVEVAACLSLGLVRPAIFSIRVQLELLLAWIYFNDHPVEWTYNEKTNEDYPMRARLTKYLSDYNGRFLDRYKLLVEQRTRKYEDPYSLLSIHVHSITAASTPTIGPLASVVNSIETCDECIELQTEVAEYLTDTLAAWYADRWHDFPSEIKDSIRGRLTAPQLKKFCS
jgi:hypothetical protein